MHRLFAALRPPPAVRAALLAAMGGVPGARWQDDEQLHLTVRFIGEVPTPIAEDVAAALSRVAAAAPTIVIEGVGSFDRRGRLDTLWARVVPDPALTALFHKVDRAMVRAGVAPEQRRFTPHLTLARIGRAGADAAALARWMADHAALRAPAWRAEHLVLYESRLGHEGARYEAVARWPLPPPS